MIARRLCVFALCSALMALGRAADFESGLRALAKRDYAAAFKEFAPLAKRGDDLAQYNLAAMYYRGDGVAQDYKEAERLFRLSAQQGNAQAQYFLGNMLGEGNGVDVDKAQAAKWYRLAAEEGVPLAQFGLGWLYWAGAGVPKDKIQAYKWFSLCIDGDRSCAKSREELAKEMTGAQITEAERLVRARKPDLKSEPDREPDPKP